LLITIKVKSCDVGAVGRDADFSTKDTSHLLIICMAGASPHLGVDAVEQVLHRVLVDLQEAQADFPLTPPLGSFRHPGLLAQRAEEVAEGSVDVINM
jgi:hypothetical protein